MQLPTPSWQPLTAGKVRKCSDITCAALWLDEMCFCSNGCTGDRPNPKGPMSTVGQIALVTPSPRVPASISTHTHTHMPCPRSPAVQSQAASAQEEKKKREHRAASRSVTDGGVYLLQHSACTSFTNHRPERAKFLGESCAITKVDSASSQDLLGALGALRNRSASPLSFVPPYAKL